MADFEHVVGLSWSSCDNTCTRIRLAQGGSASEVPRLASTKPAGQGIWKVPAAY